MMTGAQWKPVFPPSLPLNEKEGKPLVQFTTRTASEVAAMAKTFNNFLVLCAVVIVVTGIVFLFYKESVDLDYLSKTDLVENATVSVSKILKKRLDELLEERMQFFDDEKTNATLEPCPDDPPNLIGPFSVEFSPNRSWNEVRSKIRAPLQDGGRHKPKNCVSKHKVRKPTKLQPHHSL